MVDAADGWGIASEVAVSRRPLIGGDLLAITFIQTHPSGSGPAGHWELRGAAWLAHVLIDLLGSGLGLGGAALLILNAGPRRRHASSDTPGLYPCPGCGRSSGLVVTGGLTLAGDGSWPAGDLQLVACGGCPLRGVVVPPGWPAVQRLDDGLRGYLMTPTAREALRSLIALCPAPSRADCRCPAHQRLGQRAADGRWCGLEGFSVVGRFSVGPGRPATSSTVPELDMPVVWERNKDPDQPYQAVIDGRHWRLRLSQLATEPLYTLLIDDRPVTTLSDWPASWWRPGPGPGPGT